MPTTPTYGLPWPLGSDTPDAPRDFQALAEATETAVQTSIQGHARGVFAAQSVPNGSKNLTPTVSSITGLTTTGTSVNLLIAGFYTVAMTLEFNNPSVGSRAFAELRVPSASSGAGVATIVRSTVAAPEEKMVAATTCYSNGSGQVSFNAYQSSGVTISGVTGSFWIKYVGA